MRTPFALAGLSISLVAAAQAPAPQPAPQGAQSQRAALPRDKSGRPYHVVKAGDTLFSISAQYNVKLQALLDWNGIHDNVIYEEQRIYVGPPRAMNAPPSQAITQAAPQVPATLPEGQAQAPAPEDEQAGYETRIAQAKPQGNEDPADDVAPNQAPTEQFVYTQQKPTSDPGVKDADNTVLTGKPQFQRTSAPTVTTRQAPKAPATPPQVVNPYSGQALPATSRDFRPILDPGSLPSPAPMAELLAPLPVIDIERNREEWSPVQRNICKWWEGKIARTVGILRGHRWIQDNQGAALILLVAPTNRTTSTLQVRIPGAYLPADFDLSEVRRWAAAGLPVDVAGHLGYLDGPGAFNSIRRGELLSPWQIVGQVAQVRQTNGGWLTFTGRIQSSVTLATAPTAAPAASK